MLMFLLPTAFADPLPGVVSDDPFDMTQGTVISDVVPTPDGPYASDATTIENSFQDGGAGVEEGVGFWTDMGSNTEPAWVELTLPEARCVSGVRLFAAHDTDPAFYNRAMNGFQLIADPDGAAVTMIDAGILVPYADQPGNSAPEPTQLDLVLEGPPTVASVFRVAVQQHVEANSPYNGVRIIEVDALLCDADGDGVEIPDDCDDEDPDIPSDVEVCDNKDNDCDGQIDNEAVDAQTFYQDADRDGYANPNVGILACIGGNGYIPLDEPDCNDGDALVNPGATETVGDGVDSDCDGQDPPAPVEEAEGCGCSQVATPDFRWVFSRR